MRTQLKAVLQTDTMPKLNTSGIPAGSRISIAQIVLKAIEQDFQRPEVREDYERWKRERSEKHDGDHS